MDSIDGDMGEAHQGQAAVPSSSQSPGDFVRGAMNKVTDSILWDVGGYLVTDLGAKAYEQS